jgi:tetratricopeptide (TPR) repeat protein
MTSAPEPRPLPLAAPPSGAQSIAGLARAIILLIALLLSAAQPVLLPIARSYAAASAAGAQQDYAAAADALADIAARLPFDGQAAHRAGLAEISDGRFDAAIRHLNAAAALEGWTSARRIAVGDAYQGIGDSESALAQWELARADAPEDDGLLARLANQYEAAGRYANAIEVLTVLARVRANDASVFYRLALLTAATVPAEATARLAIVIEIAPQFAPQARSLIDAIQTGEASGNAAYTFGLVGFALVQLSEWRLAEEALGRAVAADPDYADAYAYLGLALDRQNKDGMEAYQTAVRLAPQSPLAQFLLGLYYRRAGDSGAALPYLQAAQATDPQNPAIAAEIGGAYASLGDLGNAEIWLTEAVKKDERSPQFWLLLARFYIDHEYHVAELGLPAARMAVNLAPDSAQALDALGYALLLTGDLDNAGKLLIQALAADAPSASIYYHLGILYVRLNRATEAEAALNKALALDPDGFYGGLALQALAHLTPAAP